MASFAALAVIADRFEVLRPLGAGGLAEVYAARDRVTGQQVAVKVLHAHLAHDEKLGERFRREMAVARGLDHPGIVRVFDFYQHQERDGRTRSLLAMELLAGETLADKLSKGKLPREEAFRIARAAAQALQAAHRAGVVHRDLKPQNIFVTENGAIKLLDFGSARAAGWVRLAAQSTLLGTPSYMAPEIFAGLGADARADLYSLGATLFEMLTGKQAFAGADPFALLKLKAGEAPSPRAVDGSVSAADDALVRRAMERDPERRYLDAGQLLRALEGHDAPAPLAPGPALTAGEVDVLLHGGAARKVDGLLDLLGTREAPRAWKARMTATGRATLVSGVSRATAETLAAICQEQGLGVALEPTRPPSRWQRLFSRAPVATGLTGGIGTAALVAGTIGTEGLQDLLLTKSIAAATWLGFSGVVGLAAGAAVGLVGWALAGGGAGAAVERPSAKDPTVARLADGIARRTARLVALRDGAPALPATAGELVAAAARLHTEAQRLAAEAQEVPDPLASADPEAVTIPPGALERRDACLQRLLEIASALDEALALLEAPQPDPAAQAALVRLLEEKAFAAEVLPAVREARAQLG